MLWSERTVQRAFVAETGSTESRHGAPPRGLKWRTDMEYKKLIKSLDCDGSGIRQDVDGCSNRRCKYRDADGACNLVRMCSDASNAITDLLARAEAAEARAEKAERERDEAISDLTWAVNEYRRLTTETDLCGLCKYDLPPAGENGQTYECPGFYKDDCFKWHGQKED